MRPALNRLLHRRLLLRPRPLKSRLLLLRPRPPELRLHRLRPRPTHGHNLLRIPPPPPPRAPTTAHQQQDQQRAQPRREPDDQTLMLIDPAPDLARRARPFALPRLALAAGAARRALEEVLLHGVAGVGAEGRRRAGDLASVGGAGVRVVALCVGGHEGLALQVAGRALA
jgi:hypothetical protein